MENIDVKPTAITDEIEEKKSSTNARRMEEIPINTPSRVIPPPAVPTIVQLPSKPPQSATISTPDTNEMETIDPEVFSELPVEIQHEIIRERAASATASDRYDSRRSNSSTDGSDLRPTSSHSSRESSMHFESGEGDTLRPQTIVAAVRPHSPPTKTGWTCHVCTFVNHPDMPECEICETPYLMEEEVYFLDHADRVRPASATNRSRASSSSSNTGSSSGDLYSKWSLKTSAMSRSFKNIHFPATPITTSLTNKENPTAEDLLLAATTKLQKLQTTASQSLSQAKETILAKAQSSRSRRTNSLDMDAAMPSPQAALELSVLQKDLNAKCETGDLLFENLLKRLWNAIYMDAPTVVTSAYGVKFELEKRPFERISDGWIDMGFQGTNPGTDFRGGGLLALKCLVYAFEAYPHKMMEIVVTQRPSNGAARWYPVCAAGVNLTCMIAGLLKLGNGKYEQTPETFWKLFEEPSAFYELFYHTFVKMDATWRRMNVSYMEFGSVLKAVRKMVIYMLGQGPKSLNDLCIAADNTFIDRFVVCLDYNFLADSENGECPDPYNVLEDESEVLLTSSRSSLSMTSHLRSTTTPLRSASK